MPRRATTSKIAVGVVTFDGRSTNTPGVSAPCTCQRPAGSGSAVWYVVYVPHAPSATTLRARVSIEEVQADLVAEVPAHAPDPRNVEVLVPAWPRVPAAVDHDPLRGDRA